MKQSDIVTISMEPMYGCLEFSMDICVGIVHFMPFAFIKPTT